MKITRYIPAVALLLSLQMSAQSSKTKKADKHYDRLEYVSAIEAYEKLVDKGHGDTYVYQRLADANHKIFNTTSAAKYYKLYLDNAEDVDPIYHYRYAQVLMSNSDYGKAKEQLREFARQAPNDSRAERFMADPDYIEKLRSAEERYQTDESSLNSSYTDFGVYEQGNTLYFVSARNKSRRTYGWNNQPTLDIYTAQKEEGGSYGEAEPIGGEVNTKYNEGTVSIAPDGNTMYFSRNDYLDGDYESDEAGIGRLKIYQASRINGEWDDVQELPFNSSEYTTAHPALSPDGNTLYFSSDMPGGYGGADLYKVSIDGEGNFGEPQNLGSGINTEGKENFPYIDKEGTLYFSSDGHPNLGGLDVFYVAEDGNVENMGVPVNTNGDDFGFSYDPETKKGWVSSNRGGTESGMANDNIYEVEEIVPPKEIDLMVKVIDAETGRPIADASVTHYDDNGGVLNNKNTDASGETSFLGLLASNSYSLRAEAVDYHSNTASVPANQEGEVEVVIELTPVEPMITEEEVVLKPIYFDFDKSDILPEAAMELDTLIDIMEKHPGMVIAVESHTDTQGSASYNQQLSERRAKSTVTYIMSKGISESRISGQGLGESDPKVNCGGNCTKEDHAQNRRSVFRIVKKE